MFTPSPARAADILEELARPNSSLEHVAQDHGTTVDDLTLWLITPHVRASIERMVDAVALHLRLVTMSTLPAVVGTLADQLIAYEDDEKTYPINRSTHPNAQETRRSNARRACGLLFRIARFVSPDTPPASRRPRPASPAQAEGAADRPAIHTPAESSSSKPPSTQPPTHAPAVAEAQSPAEPSDSTAETPDALQATPAPAAPSSAPASTLKARPQHPHPTTRAATPAVPRSPTPADSRSPRVSSGACPPDTSPVAASGAPSRLSRNVITAGPAPPRT